MISETDFKDLVADLGYTNVTMDAEIEVVDAIEILWEYMMDHRNDFRGTMKLRDVHEQVIKMQEVIK